MEIKDRTLDEIHPYEANPRRNDQAVEAVANSIREFGFKVPIVIDRDGTIVAGHTRYKAAKALGLKSVPCIVADDLTPDQVKAFRLADILAGCGIKCVFARRVLPEIYETGGADLVSRLVSLLHDGGVEYVVLEGRKPSRNAVNPLCGVDQEIAAVKGKYSVVRRFRNCCVLRRRGE